VWHESLLVILTIGAGAVVGVLVVVCILSSDDDA
jgi:DMSO reductase anchor subunit